MTSAKHTTFVDISQFASEPYATGVQRVVRGLLEHFPDEQLEPIIGFLAGPNYHIVEMAVAVEALGEAFSSSSGPDAAKRCLSSSVKSSLPPPALPHIADAYLLPEPTFRPDVLVQAETWGRDNPRRTFAIVCDALPQLEPWAFHGPEQSGTSPYFRLVASLQNVAAISEHALGQVARTAQGRVGDNWIVASPGADSMAESDSRSLSHDPHGQLEANSFVALGTVEPRKRLDLVLDSFELLWQQGGSQKLTVVGRPGWASPTLVARLEALVAEPDSRVTWIRACTDSELVRILSSATGLLYLSENEGYGLPPLEALQLGCPVIVGSQLPALGVIDGAGQIRIDDLTPQRVAAAVATLEDTESNRAMRAELDGLALPTWQSFGATIGGWITGALPSS